jgi:phosphoglycerate dehydrogenase-like enzyme
MPIDRRYFTEDWNPERFRIALTADFFREDGNLVQPDVGLSILEPVRYVEVAAFPDHDPSLRPEQVGSAQGVIVRGPRVTAESFKTGENLLAVARFGVGYDSVDVAACTNADVMLFITPGAVDRPVAEATLAWMLALSHQMKSKDRMVREGAWQLSKHYVGWEIRERTLGIIGLGRIGRAVAEIIRSLGMNQPLAFDPWADPGAAAEVGVKLVSLDELLRESDFVSIHCPLNEHTRNLIGARELGLMKSEAFLINVARGGVVNEDALYEALKSNRIAGAAIDVFVGEPLAEPSRFGEFDNVLLAPHAIAVTREHGRDIGRMDCQGMVDLTQGRVPRGVINPEVLDRPGFQAKWKRLRERLSSGK